MRSLINVKIKPNKQIRSPNINNQIETEPDTISEAFNKFFSTFAKDVDNKIIPTNKNLNSLFLTPINDKGVELLIKEMSTPKSVGPCSIPTNVLKLS